MLSQPFQPPCMMFEKQPEPQVRRKPAQLPGKVSRPDYRAVEEVLKMNEAKFDAAMTQKESTIKENNLKMVEQKRLITALEAYLEERSVGEVPSEIQNDGEYIQVSGIEHLKTLEDGEKCNVLQNLI